MQTRPLRAKAGAGAYRPLETETAMAKAKDFTEVVERLEWQRELPAMVGQPCSPIYSDVNAFASSRSTLSSRSISADGGWGATLIHVTSHVSLRSLKLTSQTTS